MPGTRRTSAPTRSPTSASRSGRAMAARQVFLDTETTGLNARLGDRVIEIGCVEVLGRSVSERHFHRYLNPGREIEEGAAKVHGLTQEFLADKPRFPEVAAITRAWSRF